ncbi:MAG TPA: hypothetical protein ENN81_11735 [Phycisphaerales bacterium]|nr:hypothetical protein [Phycisphaerales bacterium]
MSTLTKVLVILLSISAVFLCAAVVTYVASADNYKQRYESQRNGLSAAQQRERQAQDDLNAAKQEYDRKEASLSTQITALKTQNEQFTANLTEKDRQVSQLTARLESIAKDGQNVAIAMDNNQRILDNTLAELNKVQAEKIKLDKELKETTATLMEKMSVIDTLKTQNERLVAEKADLDKKISQLMTQYGKTAPVTAPVVSRQDMVQPAAATTTSNIGLKGVVTAVDAKNSLAEISIGSANGVRQDMKFHVTRGAEFVCDILILDVDADRAVGILDLVRQQPRVGDAVSTNL